jgi:hypothetical protein
MVDVGKYCSSDAANSAASVCNVDLCVMAFVHNICNTVIYRFHSYFYALRVHFAA